MAAQPISEEKIVNGPAKIDILLSQYDYPRAIEFELAPNEEKMGSRTARCRIRSATFCSDGSYILVGTVMVGRLISGEHRVPMFATYYPHLREGMMTINQTGRGTAVIYFPTNGSPRIRFDIGARKAVV